MLLVLHFTTKYVFTNY